MSDPHPPPPPPPPPPDPPTNGSNPTGPPDLAGPISTATAPPRAVPPPPPAAPTTSKRQRRPSVRLGDIGEQAAASDPFLRRSKHFKLPHSSAGPTFTTTASTKNPYPNPNHSKTRALPQLDPLPLSPTDDTGANLETLAASVRSQNPKYPRRGRKVRSAWTSSSSKPAPDGDEDEGFRSEFDDLRRDDSFSPSDRDRTRHDPPASDNDTKDWNENGNIGLEEDGGVRLWLNRLGLGRYAPVFEIHEVDDEVLPLLTLEDLKDMGINAVGSRRKMYCAIQKLKKNFT